MRNLLLMVVVLAMVFAVSGSTNAQSMMSLSIGADVLLPMGTFGDIASTGFGGSVRGQYDVTPMFSVGLNVGYFTWSGKDVSILGVNISRPKFSGIPIRAFGKYYFMPAGEKMRVYGMGELGFFMASVGDITIPAQTIGGVTIPAQTVAGTTETNFSYAPGLGAEFGLGEGNTKLDVSVRYDAIATTGSTSGSIAGRVGVTFPLGN